MDFYKPEEDSYLMCKIVEKYLSKSKNAKMNALDICTGSGIQSENMIKCGINKNNILAVDINPKALEQASKLGVISKKSNLFENVKGKFDLIVFNPPYLPEDKYDDKKDTTGGKKGDEILVNFIKSLSNHLNKNGVCFVLTSSLTPNSWKKVAKNQNFKIRKNAEKNLFFERLYIWKISHI